MPAIPRRTRSDALQNRARLLEVAAQVFAGQGLDTAPAAIAKRAGVIASGVNPFADSHALLTGAVGALLDAGARDGSLRTDVAPDDVLLLMGGLAYSAQHGTEEQARRLIGLCLDALTKKLAS
ncbi:hypothetical protein VSH64_09245 [Amycolatopsis rhabdoformis]|uniref:Transcriptional regulator SbtR-like C-terminal domain-containing protein n=1 Tax=Amycolatopsis rhabdoformis TaxID=1448059 RepID=A0ABZ1ID11_9PSEU|nr:hypothetical protein [Amycolatopsis rhabdoformis]WSE32292.1 hypothetical protein VSH64_09245 [Amycolatopsis rhabdoformis]